MEGGWKGAEGKVQEGVQAAGREGGGDAVQQDRFSYAGLKKVLDESPLWSFRGSWGQRFGMHMAMGRS